MNWCVAINSGVYHLLASPGGTITQSCCSEPAHTLSMFTNLWSADHNLRKFYVLLLGLRNKKGDNFMKYLGLNVLLWELHARFLRLWFIVATPNFITCYPKGLFWTSACSYISIDILKPLRFYYLLSLPLSSSSIFLLVFTAVFHVYGLSTTFWFPYEYKYSTFSSSGCGKIPEIVKGMIQKAVCWIATLSSRVNAPWIHLAAAEAFCVGVVNKLDEKLAWGRWKVHDTAIEAVRCLSVTLLSKHQKFLTISCRRNQGKVNLYRVMV
jgi:hypothetical protein